jgi:hypothetical protein
MGLISHTHKRTRFDLAIVDYRLSITDCHRRALCPISVMNDMALSLRWEYSLSRRVESDITVYRISD